MREGKDAFLPAAAELWSGASFAWLHGFAMRSSFSLPSAGNIWSTDHIQTLRRLLQQGLSVQEIALAMKRSESAIRNKAIMHGMSLRGANRPLAAATKQQQAEISVTSTLLNTLEWR
jgi:hypothetical protein